MDISEEEASEEEYNDEETDEEDDKTNEEDIIKVIMELITKIRKFQYLATKKKFDCK